MRPTTQPHPSAISFSAVPCEIDYSEPYSTPWAISPESVLPVGPSVVFSLIQYASVNIYYLRITTQSRQVWPSTTHHSPLEAKQALQGRCWVHPSTALYS